MLRLALLLIVPCLISAEATCPDGETTCPEGQTCCTVNNKQSCCDGAQLPLRSYVLVAAGNSSAQNGWCNTLTNCIGGTCCDTGKYGCCRAHQFATCCAEVCCQQNSMCCSDGCCPPPNNKCCDVAGKQWCCKSNERCGLELKTCYAGAGALSPTTLVTLLAALFGCFCYKHGLCTFAAL